MKYLRQSPDPVYQDKTDEEIDEINDAIDDYYESIADDKRYDEKY